MRKRNTLEDRFTKKYQILKLNNHFPMLFSDSNGEEFRAKPDFGVIDTETGKITILELKHSRLGRHKTIESCRKKLLNSAEYLWLRSDNKPLKELTHYELSALLWKVKRQEFCFKHAWNHQAVKHQIISEELQKLGIGYKIVFDYPERLIPNRGKHTPYKIFYWQKYSLNCLSVEGFEKWLEGSSCEPLSDEEFLNCFQDVPELEDSG